MPSPSTERGRAGGSALIVSRQSPLGALASFCLNHCRIETRIASTVPEAAALLGAQSPDLLIADVSDGLDAMAFLTKSRGPERPGTIAMLRERGSMLEAFEKGADQVVMLPFTPDELAVRAGALLRRLGRPVPLDRDQPVADFALSLDERIEVSGRSLALNPVMNSLLYLLAANRNRLVAIGDIRALVWGFGPDTSDRVIESQIRKLEAVLGGSASIRANQQGILFAVSPREVSS